MQLLRIALLALAASLSCLTTLAQNNSGAAWTENWQLRDAGNSGWGLNAIAWGNQLYVAVGDNGTIVTSADGIHWITQKSDTTQNLHSVTHAKNGADSAFVTVGAGGTILVSRDGSKWEPRTGGRADRNLWGVIYAQNRIVIDGEENGAVSEDLGETFTQTGMWSNNHAYGLAYGNGTFIAAGASRYRQIFSSQDGKAWDQAFSVEPEIVRYFAVAFADGIGFLAVAQHVNWAENGGDFCGFSVDGINWRQGPRGSGYSMFGLTYGDDVFVAVGNEGQVSITSDGTLWQHFASGTNRRLRGVTFAIDQFVSVGQDGVIMTSPHGNAWDVRVQPVDGGPGRHIHGVANGPNGNVAVGSRGTILRSPDGVTWTNQNIAIDTDLLDVSYAAGRFVIVGSGGLIMVSETGDIWNSITSGTDKRLYRIRYLNGQFIVVGDEGTVLISRNGIDYISGTASANLRDVEYGLGRFVAVGEAGALFVSTDATHWRQLSLGNGSHVLGVRYGNGIFLAVGRDGVAWASNDGELWRPRPSTGSNLLALDFGNGQFLAAGENSIVLTSSDGKVWKPSDLGVPGRKLYGARFVQDTAFVVGEFATIFQASDVPTSGSGPVITTQPTTQLVAVGGEATLVVEASGQGPLSFQWYLNGAPVQGAVGPSLTLTNLTLDDTGKYTVKVNNFAGSVTSSPAILVGTPNLELGIYAGLTLTGTPGQSYGIEYTSDLAGNDVIWKGLDQVTLTNKTQLWFDLGSSQSTRRFYRATPVF